MTQMNKEIKEKWLSALRSGEYLQCTGKLHDGVGFCCLGVLTDLYIKDTEIGTWSFADIAYTFLSENEDNNTMLPEEVVEWAGISGSQYNSNPDVGTLNGFGDVSLSALNDGSEEDGIKEHDFEEIATIIENSIEGI